MATSPSSSATGGSMALHTTNMWLTSKFLPRTLGQCSALAWARREKQPKHANSATFAVPGLRQVHNEDELPTPTFKASEGIGPNEPDLEELHQFQVSTEVAKYTRKFGVPETTLDLRSKSLPAEVKELLGDPIAATAMILHWHQFQSLPDTYRRFGNDVADAASVVTKLSVTDLIAALEILDDAEATPITDLVIPSQNYGSVGKIPTYHLTIHPHQLQSLRADVIGTSGYTWVAKPIIGTGNQVMFKNHVGTIPELGVDVFVDRFVRKQFGVATNATANMKQNGGVNVLYNAVLQGADSICTVSLGDEMKVSAYNEVGEAKTVVTYRGVQSGFFEAKPDAHRVEAIAVAYFKLFFGAALVYQEKYDATKQYRAVELINTAHAA